MATLFEQFKQQMIADVELFQELKVKEKNAEATPEDEENLYKALHRASKGIELFSNNISRNMPFSKIDEAVLNNDSSTQEKHYEEFLKRTAELLASKGINNFNDKDFVKQFMEETNDDRNNFVESVISELDPLAAQEVRNALFTEFVFQSEKIPTKENITAGFLNIKLNNIDVKDEDIPDKDSYAHAFDLGDKVDIPSMNKEIDEFIKTADKNDKELIEALEDSRKILIRGKEGVWNANDPSELMGDASNILSNIETMEDFKKYKSFEGKNVSISKSKREISFDNVTSANDKSSMLREVFDNRIVLDKQSKDNVMNMYNQVIGCGLKIKEAYLEPSKNGRVPHGVEMWVFPLQKQLKKAITEKDADGVKNARNQFRKYEKSFDKMLSDFKKINPSNRFAGNISLSRVAGMPSKYRYDVAGVSKLNGFISTIGYCERNGYDFKKFANDPVKGYKEIIDIAAKNLRDKVNNLINQKDLPNTIFTFTDGQTLNDTISENIYSDERNLQSMYKVGECFGPILGEKAARDFYTQGSVLTGYASDRAREITLAYGFRENPQLYYKIAERMILAEKEDRDLFALSENVVQFLDPDTLEPKQPFNEVEYYKTKTNPAGVASRALEVYEGYLKEPLKRAPNAKNIKMVAQNALTHIPTNDRSYDVKIVCDAIKNNQLDKITPQVRANLNLQVGLMKFKNQKVTSENVTEAMAKLAAVQNIYNKHGFFSKLFNSNIQTEKRLLDSMYQKIAQDTGTNVKDLKAVVSQENKGEVVKFADKVGDMKNNLVEKERTEKINNFNKQYRSIFNSEENNKTSIVLDELNESKDKIYENDPDKTVYLTSEELEEINNEPSNDENQNANENDNVMQ